MTLLLRTPTKRLLQRLIRKSCYFSEEFALDLHAFLLSVTRLKTLGRGIPKLVSLFEPVKLLVANADKHELCQNEELPEAEFDGLGEDEITQLKRWQHSPLIPRLSHLKSFFAAMPTAQMR